MGGGQQINPMCTTSLWCPDPSQRGEQGQAGQAAIQENGDTVGALHLASCVTLDC